MKVSRNDFDYLRIGVVSPELRIANVDFNVRKILEECKKIEKEKVEIIVFPELSLTGYSCGDLFFQKELQSKGIEGLRQIKEFSQGHPYAIIVGVPLAFRDRIFNCAAVICDGEIAGIVPKTFLANSSEYYEKRWFTSGLVADFDSVDLFEQNIPFGSDLIFVAKRNSSLTFGIEICQDLWSIMPPSFELCLAGAKVIINLSASDDYVGKFDYRRTLVATQSARGNCAYVYADSGSWESSTDLVFSGHSLIAENGRILAESKRFELAGASLVADIDLELLTSERQKNDSFRDIFLQRKFRFIEVNIKKSKAAQLKRPVNPFPFLPKDNAERSKVCKEIFEIQSTALARRLLHTGSKDVVIGISGGLDSTLALLVSLQAFEKLSYDKRGIHCVIMPGFGTSERTKSNAENLVQLFNTSLEVVDIRSAVSKHLEDIGVSADSHDIVYENAQARERTQILMDLGNKYNGLVVGTGDLSEIALGWSTYNADHMSMYNVNAGVPKTLVRYVIRWVAEEFYGGEISQRLLDIIDTPISPELLPSDENGEISQKTEEIIGPFDLNDFFLYYLFRYGFKPKKIYFLATLAFGKRFTEEEIAKWLSNFIKRFFLNQFKRSCMPDGPKVGTVALSPRGDWRMPSDAEFAIWLEDLNELVKGDDE